MQKAKSNGKGEKKFFFPACQLERARVLGFLAKHLAAIKGNKGSEGTRKVQFLKYLWSFSIEGVIMKERKCMKIIIIEEEEFLAWIFFISFLQSLPILYQC